MIELYINNTKADLQDNINVVFNYSTLDVDSPAAIKNNFSTTVKLKGTKTNNNIFGHLWKLDRINGDSGFDASKRVDFRLVDNGRIIEQGYLQLNEISVNDKDIEYSITLYGGLGDFFYNLMYDESEKEKSLKDVYFGWKESQLEESSEVLGYWNRFFIQECWDRLEYDSTQTIQSDITAIPCYNGLNENFDNNKCLIDLQGISSSLSPYLPSSIVNGGTTYTPYLGRYALVEMPRNLVEWEAKDLRSNQQRIGLRFSSFFDAISNPDYNGGYNVVLDDEFRNSPYFKKSYILLNKPDWSKVFGGNSSVTYISNAIYLDTTTHSSSVSIKNNNDSWFNTEGMYMPSLDIKFRLRNEFPSSSFISRMYNTWHEDEIEAYVGDLSIYRWDGIAVRAEMYDLNTNTYIGASDTVIFSNIFQYGFGQTVKGDVRNRISVEIANALTAQSPDKPYASDKIIYENFQKSLLSGNIYAAEVSFNPLLPTYEGRVTIKLVAKRISAYVDYTVLNADNPSQWTYRAEVINYPRQWYLAGSDWANTHNDQIYATRTQFDIVDGRFYDQTADPTIQPMAITKDVLFGGTKSPYKYLVDFTKMFNLKYRYDQITRTIYIEKRSNYYQDEVIPLKVDLGKNIKINPVILNSKWYKLGLSTPETYASLLYNKKNIEDYGSYRFDTKYEFNNAEKNILEGNIYKNLIPYTLSSYYLKSKYVTPSGGGPSVRIPNVLLSPSYKYTLYNGLNDNYQSIQSAIFNVVSGDYGSRYPDTSSKLCSFGINNDYISETSNSIVLFNGFDSFNSYTVSDTTQEMVDLNNTPCYLYTRDSNKALLNVPVPVFTTYIDFVSLNFNQPSQVFDDYIVGNSFQYIFPSYWASYLNDLYNKNTKSITAYIFIDGDPKEAMRKFYTYDNCLWVISEIKNYIVGGDKPVQAKLIRVNDKSNYLT